MYMYIYLPPHTFPGRLVGVSAAARPASACRPPAKREVRGSRGMGFDDWFDRVLLSILHMFEPSC